MAKLVSKTYGDALFELALEKQTIDTVFEEVKEVKEVFTENEELMKLLNHPKITKDEKVKIIEELFKGKVSDDVTGFLVIIMDKGRYGELTAIFDYFIAKVKEYKKIGIAKVTSAVVLSDEQKAKLEEKLLKTTSYTSFEMDYNVDKSLIGGLIIRIGDRVVDSSIKTKLDKLARDLQKIQLSTC